MVAVRRRQMGSKLLFNDSTLFSGCFLEECCRRASEGSAGPGPARPQRREDERMGHRGADAAASGHTSRGWSGGSAPAFILSPCLPFVVLSAALTHRPAQIRCPDCRMVFPTDSQLVRHRTSFCTGPATAPAQAAAADDEHGGGQHGPATTRSIACVKLTASPAFSARAPRGDIRAAQCACRS